MTAVCQALVLAASRPQDPVARRAGQSHKALVRAGGVPMLIHVLRALQQSQSIGQIAVCLEADAPVAGAEPQFDRLLADGTVTLIEAASSPSRSVLTALATLPLPLLITTADHPLLSAAMVDHFCETVPADADAAVAVVRASLLQQEYPGAIRTYYRFAGEGYSGCNLFLLQSPDALRAVELWTRLEQHRKHPWRLIGEVGLAALVRFLLGRLDLEGAMRHLSAKVGANVRAVELPFAEAAIDVDKPADLELAEQILARRASSGTRRLAGHAEGHERGMMQRKTTISIDGDGFLINGEPTYASRHHRGRKIEGLLLNARMVQGIFDDLNPATRGRWAYPDGPWDPERNTDEMIAAMPTWHAAGLRAFTLNLQGGSPEGYSREQPWHNSAFAEDGALRADYLARLTRVLDAADDLGMAVILGLFYFGQDGRLRDEQAVIRAVEAITDWLLAQAYTHVLVEIANEVDVPRYSHAILGAARNHELIVLVQRRSAGGLATPAGRLLVSTSMRGGSLPTPAIIDTADFLLLHGNHVESPAQIRQMVRDCRAAAAYRGQPILFNEDDHFDFDAPDNHMLAAIGEYAGWGYFDYRVAGEGFHEGFQSVPVDWSTSSERKRGFFRLLAEITGARP